MADHVALDSQSRSDHWDATYRRAAPTLLSWYQQEPTVSLELLEALKVPSNAVVIDVGGGASNLVDALRLRGFLDVSVLDVSEAAIVLTRDRVGDAVGVQLLHMDALSWRPSRRYDLWHDRAVFHFLVDATDRQRYLAVLQAAVRPRSHAIIATFAPDGPEHCSGLPVARYGPADLASLLAGLFEIVEVRREEHTTPGGITQPFTWVAARASR